MIPLPSTVTLPLWVAVLIGVTIIALILIVWSVKRRRRPNLSPSGGSSESLKATLAGLLQSSLVEGNKVELIQDGEFFTRLFHDLEHAKQTINIETFLCKQGQVTHDLASILVKKSNEGIEVRMMLDGSGGRKFGKKDLERLKEAKCKVYKYHAIKLSNLGRINQRTHRKLAVIDGRIGYVGGHCMTDDWLSKNRDITARVEGPVVNEMQSAFTDNWIEESGEVIVGTKFFPDLKSAGPTPGLIAFVSPVGGPSTLKLLHYLAINEAKESITIQNPYFLPDPDARKALLEAVKRGVKVRIMLPETGSTDAKLVSHASHHHYGTLLKGGVRIFDFTKTLLHQKVFTVDHCWTSIGSTNFDDRSFEINDEISLVTFDERIARELEETFERDARTARERHLEEWVKRNPFHKIMDFCAFMLNEQL